VHVLNYLQAMLFETVQNSLLPTKQGYCFINKSLPMELKQLALNLIRQVTMLNVIWTKHNQINYNLLIIKNSTKCRILATKIIRRVFTNNPHFISQKRYNSQTIVYFH
jgi:hypothetical protein